MKFILSIIIAGLLSTSGHAALNGPHAAMNTRVTGSTNLATAFTDANAALLSTLAGVNNFAIYNGTATGIIIGTVGHGGLSCGASTREGFYVPANAGIVIEKVYINKVICAKSAGSAISSGSIFTSAW